MSGFDAAWRAYLCAMYGHVLTYGASSTSGPRLVPATCTRCGVTVPPESVWARR